MKSHVTVFSQNALNIKNMPGTVEEAEQGSILCENIQLYFYYHFSQFESQHLHILFSYSKLP